MKKFLLIASIILLLVFVTTNLLSIAFNINLKDAHAVENTFNSFSVSFMLEKYFPQESYYDEPQDNPSPLIEPFKLIFLGVGLIFLSLIGRPRRLKVNLPCSRYYMTMGVGAQG